MGRWKGIGSVFWVIFLFRFSFKKSSWVVVNKSLFELIGFVEKREKFRKED